MQAFLCGWYIYLAAMCTFLGLSAARPSWLRRGAFLAAAIAAALMVSVVWPVPNPGVLLSANVFLLVVGLWGVVLGGRYDTRSIALFVAVGSALPIALFFWEP